MDMLELSERTFAEIYRIYVLGFFERLFLWKR